MTTKHNKTMKNRSLMTNSSSSSIITQPLKKGSLTKYGYHLKLPNKTRHSALKKALKHNTPLSLSRKLNLLSVFNKNKHPRLSKTARNDSRWVITA
jgi:hypothetical protein